MPKPIYVLNGPNLNLLGTREPHIYGTTTLEDVRAGCESRAASLGHTVVFRQTNLEGELIDWVQEARLEASGVQAEFKQYGRGKNTVEEIVALCDSLPVSTLVIGLRKRSPVGKLIMGSVAQDLLLSVSCPVLAVKAPS